jgi:hypothetical protein
VVNVRTFGKLHDPRTYKVKEVGFIPNHLECAILRISSGIVKYPIHNMKGLAGYIPRRSHNNHTCDPYIYIYILCIYIFMIYIYIYHVYIYYVYIYYVYIYYAYIYIMHIYICILCTYIYICGISQV